MRIGVNTRLLLPDKLEGIGWFTFENLKRITRNNPDVEFVFFFDRPYSEEFIFGDNVKGVVLNPQARHPILYRIWFNLSIPRALKKHKIDLFLSPDGYLSLKTSVPQVAVIHDLNFEHYPEDLPQVHSNYYRKYFPKFARVAKRIATVSNHSKEDIANCYAIPTENIDVVYNGVNEAFNGTNPDEQKSIKEKYTQGSPYFVYVGSMHKRKNIVRLLKAFDRFKANRICQVKLLLVGEKMWDNPELDQCLNEMKFREDVIFTGRLYESELNGVLGASLGLCYVPYFEGFGIPILEGFACQTPVITSNVTSMPEVAGDAALLVDPFDVEDISHAMEQLYDHPEERSVWTEKGKRQLEKFSWNRSANLLWECILKAAKNDG